jgi:hypothetical protein
MAITFFKTPKNKQFDYRPIYYDAKKEEMEQKYGKTGKKSGEAGYEDELRGRMQARWRRSSATKDAKNSNNRLILIIIGLAVAVYYLLLR